ncbi:hypothetical protein [Ammoniphilus sp. CFH 90114]|uniref:hypothetical protein n=1 Tax=Ammoniphilus sp. CFH 90114 TaxID=2493665 RepID=UPI00100F6B1E|nr:hypothetical protein [Ammoniphilus sp. CFH 90114]RXT06464.1 hypothetical protein EIZ39_15455 [Ammoniphilus sp. CFH 90114]
MNPNFLNKWVSATMPLVLFFLLFGYWNPHDILVMLIWASPITYVYGICSSYALDWVSNRYRLKNKVLIAFLYSLTGALFFIPLFQFVIRMQEMGAYLGFMAIGAGIALSFYLCTLFFRNVKVNRYLAVLGPLFLIIMMQIFVFRWEFDKVDGWREHQTDNYYEASFDYFHGEHVIPIIADKGEQITFKIKWNYWQDGSTGHYVEGPSGKPVGMEELGDNTFKLIAPEDGTYKIVLTAKRVSYGQFVVHWSKD